MKCQICEICDHPNDQYGSYFQRRLQSSSPIICKPRLHMIYLSHCTISSTCLTSSNNLRWFFQYTLQATIWSQGPEAMQLLKLASEHLWKSYFHFLSKRMSVLLVLKYTPLDLIFSFTVWYLCLFCISVQKLPSKSSVFIAADLLADYNTLSWYQNSFLMCKSLHALGKQRRKPVNMWYINNYMLEADIIGQLGIGGVGVLVVNQKF